MKFTIVITTYNRLSLLRRAIDSALAQTLKCEVVVVDDCSSDGTEEYVRSLGIRVVYHRNSSNLGHAGTVNAGVQVARGEWIKLLDDDDYLAPNCVEEMARAIALHPDAVICSCQAAQVDLEEVELTRTRQIGPGKAFYIPQEDIHYGMLLERIPFGTPAQVAFCRDAFLRTGGWDSSLDTNCDDIDSWIEIAQFGDAVFINACLAYRTIWPNAYNQKISLRKRLDANILMKDKIYSLVGDRHRERIPAIADIHAYLKLHWSLVALKQKKFFQALTLASSAVISWRAWQLLCQALLSRKFNSSTPTKSLKFQDKPIANQTAIVLSPMDKNLGKNCEFIRDRLKLRCSRIAFQQKKIILGVKIGIPALFYFGKHQFLNRFFSRKFQSDILVKQVETNPDFFKSIYKLVCGKQYLQFQHLEQMRSYFKIRWSWVTLKQGKVLTAIKIALPTLKSPWAWKCFLKAIAIDKQQREGASIRKVVLIE